MVNKEERLQEHERIAQALDQNPRRQDDLHYHELAVKSTDAAALVKALFEVGVIDTDMHYYEDSFVDDEQLRLTFKNFRIACKVGEVLSKYTLADIVVFEVEAASYASSQQPADTDYCKEVIRETELF